MRNLKTYIILIFIIGMYACNSKVKSNTAEKETSIENQISPDTSQYESKKDEFLEYLKNGKELSSFFSDNWIFIYHEDNRCDGSTNGEIGNLTNTQIDTIIKLEVNNDGDGWACDQKEPTNFTYDFDLKEQVKDWDRFEIADYEAEEKNSIYILGAGESDYVKLYYNAKNMIIKLEYRSEDPG